MVSQEFSKTDYEKRMKELMVKLDQVADEQMKREKRKTKKMKEIINHLKQS